MTSSPLRKTLTNPSGRTRSVAALRKPGANRRRPVLESLEGRALLAVALTEFPVALNGPTDVVTGAGGNLWVLGTDMSGNDRISVLAADGSYKTSYSIPTPNAGATSLTPGPDGNLWFVEPSANKIGKITPAGVVSEYAIPNATGGNAPVDINAPSGPAGVQATPTSIVAGADGALWFTESSAAAIGRITTDGVITQQTPTPGMQPNSIAQGPDHAIWFTDNSDTNSIVRLKADGSIARIYQLPKNFVLPTGLTSGPDGALWFAESGNNAVGRITTDGAVTELPILGNLYSPEHLTFDPAGNLWVTGSGQGLARMTTAGLTEIIDPNPLQSLSTQGITTTSDGSIWFTNTNDGLLGRIDPTSLSTLPTDHPLSMDLTNVGRPTVYAGTVNFSDSVGTFYDGNPSATASDFSATIDWGDGTTSAGVVIASSPGQFSVTGTHTFAQFGTYDATATVSDINPSHTPQPNGITLPASIVLTNESLLPPVTPGGPIVSTSPVSNLTPVNAQVGNGGARSPKLASTTHPVAGIAGSKSAGTTTATYTPPSWVVFARTHHAQAAITAAYRPKAHTTITTSPKKHHAVLPLARAIHKHGTH